MSFYDRLRKIRLERGFSSKEMAEKLRIAASSYSQYEKGHREPDFKRVVALSKILNVTSDYLIGLVDNPDEKYTPIPINKNISTEDIEFIISCYNELNEDGKNKVKEYISDLKTIEKYTSSDTEIERKLNA